MSISIEAGKWLQGIIHRMPARNSSRYAWASSYVAAIVIVGIALAARELIGRADIGLQFVTFFPAVALTAVYGGFRPGMLATVISAILATFLYIPPYHAFTFDFHSSTVLSNLAFFLDESMVCGAIQAMHNHHRNSRVANDRLAEKHELLTAIVEGTADAIFLKDVAGRYLHCNAAQLRLIGKKLDEVVGQDAYSFFPTEQARIMRERDVSIMDRGKVENFEDEVTLPRGEKRSFVITKGPILKAGGDPKGTFGIARDITERKQAEALLRQKQIVVDTALDGFWITDMDGNLLEANAAYAEMSGYSTAELTHMHIGQLDANEQPEDVKAHIAKVLAQDGYDRFETRHRHKDGHLIDIEVSARYLREFQQLVVFCRDITAHKRAADALMSAKSDAERANKAKSRFLAAASHDLRQPLSALSLYVGSLGGRLSPADGRLLANMKNCVANLNEMLSNLLDLSKLEAGVVKPNVTDFPIDDVFVKVIASHAPEAREKGLDVRCANFGLVARTDRVLFQRMLGNLVANAIRYTRQGGVLIGCRRTGSRMWVEVWDTGIGIPENKTAEIFEEFKQLGNDERNGAKGSGLGLTIVSKTAALLGLRIRVRSRVGKGSVFAVELPIGRAVSIVPHQEYSCRALRIALVEDNLPVAEALVHSLTSIGHQVMSAASRSELMSLIESAPPDIVISDYRLAGEETGFDVIASLRTVFGKDLPAVIVTGDTDPELIRSMAEKGVRVHHKPLELQSLRASIAELTR